MTQRPPDTEKLTLNLGFVDLGRIDLLVHEGFYANRSDFIRTSIRNQLDRLDGPLEHSVHRKAMDLGVRTFDRDALERTRRAGKQLDIRVVGLVRIAPDVSAELARATIERIEVLGSLQASADIKTALADRIA